MNLIGFRAPQSEARHSHAGCGGPFMLSEIRRDASEP